MNQIKRKLLTKTILFAVLPLAVLAGMFALTNPITTQATGEVAIWHFDEGAGITMLDSSGNNNVGTLINGPVWTSGKLGNALQFDGVNDYVDVGNGESLKLQDFTIEMWLKPTGGINEEALFGNVGFLNYGIALYSGWLDYSNFIFTNGYGTGYETWAAINLSNDSGQWVHLAITRVNKVATVYKNGTATSTHTFTNNTDWSSSGNFYIGQAGSSSRYNFGGSIDEVRIYNRALSLNEISIQYNNQSIPSDFYSLSAEESANTAPTATFNSAIQKTDGTGKVDISIEVDDADDDDIKAKIEYVAGAGCDFTTPLDPTLDETEGSTSNHNDSGGSPSVVNADAYQIGTTATRRIMTSDGSNTVTFDWDSNADLPTADGTYCLRLTANDDTADQTTPDTQTVVLDNVDPSGYTVSINQSTINAGNETALSFTFASAEVGATYNYSIDDTNGTTPAITDSGTIATATDTISNIDVSSLDDDTLTLTVYLTDTSGNQGFDATDTITKDSNLPTITNISSDKPNGSYTTGEVIDIDITFSEAVTSTGDVTVTLETGDTDRTCTFTITNSITGACDYTVQAGDTSSDLDATISGAIADQASNALTNYTPVTTLSASKDLLIDTTAPTGATLSLGTITANSITSTVSGAADSGAGLHATPYYFENTTNSTNSGWTGNTSWAFSSLSCGTIYSFRVKTRDALANESDFTSSSTSATLGCGGGLPSVAYNPPTPPASTPNNPEARFKVSINQGAEYTNSFTVSLSFVAGLDTARMAISESSDFKNAVQIPYQKELKWELLPNSIFNIQYSIF